MLKATVRLSRLHPDYMLIPGGVGDEWIGVKQPVLSFSEFTFRVSASLFRVWCPGWAAKPEWKIFILFFSDTLKKKKKGNPPLMHYLLCISCVLS